MLELATSLDQPIPVVRQTLRTPAAFREAYALLLVRQSVQTASTAIRERRTIDPAPPGAALETRLTAAIYQQLRRAADRQEQIAQQAAWAAQLGQTGGARDASR